MAQREMSGKALLDKLYGGLDTMPAPQAAMDARDFRRLTDDFLGKPTDPNATGQHAATAASADAADDDEDDAPRTSRAKLLGASLVVVCLVGLAGVITVNALGNSEKQAAALPAPPPAVVAAPVPEPVEQTAEVAPAPEPVVLTNPFDRSEKFTFPPGTSKAEAREQMANLLMQRAIERGANKPRAKSKLAAEPRKPSTSHGQ